MAKITVVPIGSPEITGRSVEVSLKDDPADSWASQRALSIPWTRFGTLQEATRLDAEKIIERFAGVTAPGSQEHLLLITQNGSGPRQVLCWDMKFRKSITKKKAASEVWRGTANRIEFVPVAWAEEVMRQTGKT